MTLEQTIEKLGQDIDKVLPVVCLWLFMGSLWGVKGVFGVLKRIIK